MFWFFVGWNQQGDYPYKDHKGNQFETPYFSHCIHSFDLIGLIGKGYQTIKKRVTNLLLKAPYPCQDGM